MGRKYISPITSQLTPDNWQEKINLKDMSLDEMTDLFGDLKAMEALGKKVGGFMKEACKAHLPEGESEFVGSHFQFVLNDRYRAGGLNKDKIAEEMGEDWIEEHTNPGTEYVELRLTRVEE